MVNILMSIKPKWCELIFSGQKMDEIRRTKPNGQPGETYTVYVWQTGGGGVIGRFTVREFTFIQAWKDSVDGTKHLGNTIFLQSCLSDEELFNYVWRKEKAGKPYPGGWAWRIENTEKFDYPRGLAEFGLKRPPQSWQYIH